MATSGSTSVSIYSWLSLKYSWSQSSQSVANNTTTISWKLELISGNGSLTKKNRTWTVTNDDKKQTGTVNVNIAKNSTQTLASGSSVIEHNDDGSKKFAYSFSQQFGLTLNNGNYMGTYSGSGSDTLTTIARASQPSLVTYPNSTENVGNFGEEFSIHMNRKSSAFTHTVRYEYGDRTGTIATGVTNGTTWAVPLDFMNDIPNDTSGSGRIYVDTYNGSTKIGTKYTGFTAIVPSSVKPSCTFVLEDISGADNIYGSPVKGLSKIKVTVTGQPAYSSPIDSCRITANGVAYSGTAATTSILLKAGTSTVTATVTDKRGRSGTVSYDMTVQDYAAPTISALTVRRCDKNGTVNDRGEYVKVTFSAAVSSMSSKNTATYTLKYKKSAATDYTSVPLTALANKYSVLNYEYTFAADGSSAYDIDVTVQDRHGTASRATSASTAFTLINFHKDGNALRFGGVAEEANTFQNDLEFRQVGNHYSFQPEAYDGTKGYILLAVITLTTLNVNAPIVFQINRRGALCPMNVYVRFASSSTTLDPDLGSITYEGDNYGAFMVKSAESTWKLYVDNTTGWSNPCLQDWYTTDNQMSRFFIEFPSEIVEGADPSVLGAYYQATPAKMPSILDFIYPVGSIYLSYSHVSPASLFGGTWERLKDRFLLAAGDTYAAGATGGEATHQLTAAEMPDHQHTVRSMVQGYSGWDEMTINQHSIIHSRSGTDYYSPTTPAEKLNVAYVYGGGTGGAGEGKAHNNMPPYLAVYMYIRTA